MAKTLENTTAKVILKRGREKSVLNWHPWIFSGAIGRIEGVFHPGDIIPVYSAGNNLLGKGFINPKSRIMVRILSFDDSAITAEFFRDRLNRAIALRRRHIRSEDTAYRVIHGDGDGLSGLVVDKYNDHLVIQIFSLGMDRLRAELLEWLRELLHPDCIVERSEGGSRKLEGLETRTEILYGKLPEKIIITESSLKYQVDIMKGQKTGFYLDQRMNRAIVAGLAKKKTVLNCFSYSGGFSVAAASRGAQTTSVDLSSDAIALAEENFRLNGLEPEGHRFVVQSAFDFLGETKGNFDLIVLDPPAFVKRRQHLEKGSRAYKEINRLAIGRLTNGGLLFTCSCSSHVSWDLFQKILFSAAKDTGRPVQIIGRFGQPPDHPVSIYHPEGEYLKTFLLSVD